MAPSNYVDFMRKDALPTAEMTVDEVMRRWPYTIRAFLAFRMHCIGCPIDAFHSIDEACEEHDIDIGVFFPKILEIAKATYGPRLRI